MSGELLADEVMRDSTDPVRATYRVQRRMESFNTWKTTTVKQLLGLQPKVDDDGLLR